MDFEVIDQGFMRIRIFNARAKVVGLFHFWLLKTKNNWKFQCLIGFGNVAAEN